MATLTFDDLLAAVRGDTAAYRAVTRLAPAGGPSDKVFPPTYAVSDRATTKYAIEQRVVDGESVPAVLLDSVASQANRMELALLDAWESGDIEIPMLSVSFEEFESISDLDRITVLEAPHRIADAIFRDSELDGVPFRMSDLGRAYTDARPDHATALLRDCPMALVFGVWDSTGPKGGMGAKFQRTVVAEIVGYNAQPGVKTASRIDPLAIARGATVFQAEGEASDENYTTDESLAVKKSSKPVTIGDGRPSEINHGNIAPSIDERAGGVTIDYAEQSWVLSLPAIRRLKFSERVDGTPIERADRRETAAAAHASLAALGLAALAYQRRLGFDLRSRCLLVEEGPLQVEALGAGRSTVYDLDIDSAARLVADAHAHASKLGMGWRTDEIRLRPAAKLVALVEKSRDILAEQDPAEEG